MNQLILNKIKEFANITPKMRTSFQEVVDYWAPEFPPLTTLFSALGSSFMNEFDSFDEKSNRMVFEAIENMLEGEDKSLDVGASTGFLEAIVARPNFSKKAKEMLGERSRTFLREWNQFTGIWDDSL